jgi:hypothetical protein
MKIINYKMLSEEIHMDRLQKFFMLLYNFKIIIILLIVVILSLVIMLKKTVKQFILKIRNYFYYKNNGHKNKITLFVFVYYLSLLICSVFFYIYSHGVHYLIIIVPLTILLTVFFISNFIIKTKFKHLKNIMLIIMCVILIVYSAVNIKNIKSKNYIINHSVFSCYMNYIKDKNYNAVSPYFFAFPLDVFLNDKNKRVTASNASAHNVNGVSKFYFWNNADIYKNKFNIVINITAQNDAYNFPYNDINELGKPTQITKCPYYDILYYKTGSKGYKVLKQRLGSE